MRERLEEAVLARAFLVDLVGLLIIMSEPRLDGGGEARRFCAASRSIRSCSSSDASSVSVLHRLAIGMSEARLADVDLVLLLTKVEVAG